MAGSEADFNLKVILVSFKHCLNEKEEVLLEHYITSWKGLVRCVRGGGGLPANRRPSCKWQVAVLLASMHG